MSYNKTIHIDSVYSIYVKKKSENKTRQNGEKTRILGVRTGKEPSKKKPNNQIIKKETPPPPSLLYNFYFVEKPAVGYFLLCVVLC